MGLATEETLRELVGVTGGGDATAANQATGNASLSSIDGKTPALVAGRSPVDGSGVTQPVSAAALPLPTGAATEASLASINGKLGALGQAAMAASAPVAIASNQSAIPVKGTVTATAQLTASATLPASGAYEADPATGAMVAIPAGSRRATIYITYTRGAAGGFAGHKIFLTDGTIVAHALAPDGTYNGINGRASTSGSALSYALSVDLTGGETKIGLTSAEVGVTATPGTVASAVTFG